MQINRNIIPEDGPGSSLLRSEWSACGFSSTILCCFPSGPRYRRATAGHLFCVNSTTLTQRYPTGAFFRLFVFWQINLLPYKSWIEPFGLPSLIHSKMSNLVWFSPSSALTNGWEMIAPGMEVISSSPHLHLFWAKVTGMQPGQTLRATLCLQNKLNMAELAQLPSCPMQPWGPAGGLLNLAASASRSSIASFGYPASARMTEAVFPALLAASQLQPRWMK